MYPGMDHRPTGRARVWVTWACVDIEKLQRKLWLETDRRYNVLVGGSKSQTVQWNGSLTPFPFCVQLSLKLLSKYVLLQKSTYFQSYIVVTPDSIWYCQSACMACPFTPTPTQPPMDVRFNFKLWCRGKEHVTAVSCLSLKNCIFIYSIKCVNILNCIFIFFCILPSSIWSLYKLKVCWSYILSMGFFAFGSKVWNNKNKQTNK